MINLTVPRLYASDFPSGETRLGDSQIIGRDVIDGGCDKGAMRTIAALRAKNIRNPWLHITHGHYDHRDCADKILSDPWFSPQGLYCQDPGTLTAYNSSIRSDINALKRIIQKAKDKGVPVFYLGNDQQIKHGDLEFTVYRAYPKYTGNSDAYLNEGSLCYWFPKLRYLTTGDASLWCAYKYNLDPLIIKCGHHGNDASAGEWLKPSQMTVWLVKRGCKYYWDNDFSTHLTDFLMTGREDAINAGMIILNVHSDITMNFALGKVTIMNNGKTYTDSVPYDGKAEEGWVKNQKGWWYRFSDGTWAVGWKKLKCANDKKNGLWFYFGADGYMATGWQKVNGKWYYLDPAYGDMKTGWIFVNGVWYYLEDSGAMHTGWMDWKGKRCYLDPTNGHCLVNCTRVIDGKTYRFDKGGYAEEVIAMDVVKPGAKVIDISEFQPEGIDWSKIKAGGYAVIIRIGLRGSIPNTDRYRKISYDRHFKKYLDGVIQAGIPYSLYYFPTPLNDSEADCEAEWIITNVDGLKLSMPLWLDSERVPGGVANDISTAERTRYLKRITDRLVAAGIPCGIYASTSWLQNQISMGQLQQQVQDNTWCAQYNTKCTYDGIYAMWQYSSKAKVDGISGNVDISEVKRDFNMSCRKADGKEDYAAKDNVKIFPVTNPVKISNSGSDEHGNYKGGAAGDNTNREWYIRDWYNRPWNCVLRHPDPAVRACLADLATKAANNNRIGYDQYQRQTYWNELQKVNYDPSKITVACEADCSAGVIANVKAAGHILGKPELQKVSCTYTGNMRAGLTAAGFACLTESKYLTSSVYLVAGDILLNDKHHTATAVTNGTQADGDVIMPLIKKGSQGDAVKKMQQALNAKGYKLTEDGDFGSKTEAAVKAFQKANGLEVDGEVGPMTWGVLLK